MAGGVDDARVGGRRGQPLDPADEARPVVLRSYRGEPGRVDRLEPRRRGRVTAAFDAPAERAGSRRRRRRRHSACRRPGRPPAGAAEAPTSPAAATARAVSARGRNRPATVIVGRRLRSSVGRRAAPARRAEAARHDDDAARPACRCDARPARGRRSRPGWSPRSGRSEDVVDGRTSAASWCWSSSCARRGRRGRGRAGRLASAAWSSWCVVGGAVGGSTGVIGSSSVVRNAPARAGTAWVVARVRVLSSPASVDDTSNPPSARCSPSRNPYAACAPLTEPAGVEPPATAASGRLRGRAAVAPVPRSRPGRAARAPPGSRGRSSSS